MKMLGLNESQPVRLEPFCFREKGVPFALTCWPDGLRLLRYPKSKNPAEISPYETQLSRLVWDYYLETQGPSLGIPADLSRKAYILGKNRVIWLQLCARIPHFSEYATHDIVLSALIADAWRQRLINEKDIERLTKSKRHIVLKLLHGSGTNLKVKLKFLRKVNAEFYDEELCEMLSEILPYDVFFERLNHLQEISPETLNILRSWKDEYEHIQPLCQLLVICQPNINPIKRLLKHRDYILHNTECLKFCRNEHHLGILNTIIEELKLPQNSDFRSEWPYARSFQQAEALYDSMIFNQNSIAAQRDAAAREAQNKRRALNQQDFPSPPIPGNNDVVHIQNNLQLRKEGTSMRNCCYSYLSKIQSGNSCFYHVNSKRGATLELVYCKVYRKWYFNEIKGPHNVAVDSESRLMISNWLKSVYFAGNVDMRKFMLG
jgi:hypothetical protein